MNVTFTRRPTFDEISSDDDFQTLVSLFLAERVVRGFIVSMIRQWTETPPIGFENAGALWATTQHDPGAAAGGRDAGQLLDVLYGRFGGVDAGNLRGAILEHLVLESLRPRYGASELADNVEITITNGVNYLSPAGRPIDVVGWDGSVGECHDCKMKPAWLKADLIKHLADGLPRPQFRLGVVTTMSEVTATAALKRMNYTAPPHVTFISAEDLLDFVPLQAAA